MSLETSGVSLEIKDVNETSLQIPLKPRIYMLKVETGDRWTPGGDPEAPDRSRSTTRWIIR